MAVHIRLFSSNLFVVLQTLYVTELNNLYMPTNGVPLPSGRAFPLNRVILYTPDSTMRLNQFQQRTLIPCEEFEGFA